MHPPTVLLLVGTIAAQRPRGFCAACAPATRARRRWSTSSSRPSFWSPWSRWRPTWSAGSSTTRTSCRSRSCSPAGRVCPRPARGGRRRARPRLGGDVGLVALEWVIIAPAVFLLVFVPMQAAWYFHARNLALAAAEEGVRVARADGSSAGAGVAGPTSSSPSPAGRTSF